MRLETKHMSFEAKAAGDEGDGSTFSGLGAAYNNVDAYGDVIVFGAFAETIPYFLAYGSIRNGHTNPVGSPTGLEERADGLFLKGRIVDTTEGLDCRKLIKSGVVKGLSVGFVATKTRWINDVDEMQALWKEAKYSPTSDDINAFMRYGGVRVIEKAKLYEVSLTDMPANDMARISDVKTGPPGGRTLDDQIAAALGSVEEVAARAESYRERKSADGRPVPAKRRAQVLAVRDRLSSLLDAIDAKAAPDDDAALMDKYLQTNHLFDQLGL